MSARERKAVSSVVTWRVALNSPLSGMSKHAKHVGLSLANYMGETGEHAFPSPETLREDSGLAVSTVREALGELERGGWAVRTRRGGGRGLTNEYAATIPDSFWATIEELLGRETRRDAAGFRSARAVLKQRAQRPQEAPGAAAAPDPGQESPERETLRAAAGSGEEKPAAPEAETRRTGRKNTPHSGTEVKDLEGSRKNSSKDDGVVDAAAVDLVRRLTEHRVAPAVRALALREPERAIAWLELAERDAHSNVAGFFVVGFATGEPPSARGVEPNGISRFEGYQASLRNLMALGLDVDYARDFVDVQWDSLTSVERGELHTLIDELASERLPEPASAAEASRSTA